jgi:hypothetical protein
MGPLVKIQAATAAEICASLTLKPDVKELLREGMVPQEFVAALIEKKKHIEAIDFMAHALPAREGLWWGCLCMQHACGDNLSPPERAAATAAVQWIMHPTEENRAAAKQPAETAGAASPAGALAMAASQTGAASAKAVAMAVKIASTKAEPIKMAATQRSYVDLAIEVAEGRLI